MPGISNKTSLACSLLFAAALTACTTTIKKRKDPVFAVPTDSLVAGLNSIVTCQHFNLDGEDISVNGKDSSELEIDVINGKDIPNDNDSMKVLGQPIAALLKNALKDKGEYDRFSVYFVKVDSGSVVTKRSWVGHKYPAASLH
jgi:hypothetical protein